MKCPKHPRYQAKRKPRVACEDCWRIWFRATAPIPERPRCPEGQAWRHGGCNDIGVYDG